MPPIRTALLALSLAPAAPGQDGGMLPRWQVEELSATIVKNLESLNTVVTRLGQVEWTQNGAPPAYIEQHQTLVNELAQLKLAAEALGRQPEKLTYAVDTYLWLDRTEALLASIGTAVRRYYNPAVADLIDSARSRHSGSTLQVQQYMRQLAVHVEESMEVAHREAQRCRGELFSRPGSR